MKLNTILLILVFGILCSCRNDDNECEGRVVGPDFTLPEDTKAYISHYTDKSKIIYLDLATNEEVEFTIAPIDRRFYPYSGAGPCPADTTIRASINGNSELIKLALENSILEESIVYTLMEFPGAFDFTDLVAEQATEVLIQYGSVDDSIVSGEPIMILELDQMTYYTISDSLVIGATTFYNVIERDDSNPGLVLPSNPTLEVKLTREQGIVYINDLINNRELVYLRVE